MLSKANKFKQYKINYDGAEMNFSSFSVPLCVYYEFLLLTMSVLMMVIIIYINKLKYLVVKIFCFSVIEKSVFARGLDSGGVH